MKKNWLIILVAAFSVILVILSILKADNTKFAKIEIGKSSVYSKEEVNDAIKIVLKKFKKDYPATLEKLWYEENLKENEEWANTYNVEEAIVLYSNFRTYSGSKVIRDGLNPNSEYSKWSWVLVRNNHGNWELKNWGQG